MLPDDWPRSAGIYKIFFLDPNLFYIGSAINLRTRWSLHRRQLQKGTHHNIHLQRTYAKYGEEALHFEVIEHIERREDLIIREQYYLDTLKPHFNIFKNARNMLGLKHTEEAKEKNRIAHLGKAPPNKGKPMSEEQKQYYRDLYTGKPHGHRTNNGQPSPKKGKPAPPNAIAKMLATRAERGIKSIPPRNTPESREKRKATWANRTPEQEAQRIDKWHVTMANKTPKQKAEIVAKREAAKAARFAAEPRKWSMLYDSCLNCGTTKSHHAGHGLCDACHQRQRKQLRG